MPLQLSKGRRVPSFQLTTSDNVNNRLPTQVTFSNGVKDEIILKGNQDNKCNYLGHLHGDPISVIGASGCLTKHGDEMEITLILHARPRGAGTMCNIARRAQMPYRASR